MKIRIQSEDFDVSAELAALSHAQVGALVSFVGTVRSDDGLTHMELEHYPGMTETSLTAIAQQAQSRWEIGDVVIIHRVGMLPAGAQIVLVATASRHRAAAFAACEFIMDYLKTDAPFWKKEYGPNGAHWVDARSTDMSALDKWC
jgi:molybdopterin synthase catalytic subunit